MFGATDRLYSNGLQLAWTGRPGRLGQRGTYAFGERWVDVRVVHEIYTPRGLRSEQPPPGQRPYAATLRADVAWLAFGSDRLASAALQLGVLGPAAGGEPVQDIVHRIIGDRRPLGWDSQLSARLIAGVDIDYAALSAHSFRRHGTFVFAGYAAGQLTSIRREFIAGGALEIGFRTDRADIGGVLSPRLGAPCSPREARFGFGLYAATVARLVAHDHLIEGANFSPRAEPLIAEARVGVIFRFRRARLRFIDVFQTKSFEGQSRPHIYGAVDLAVPY